MEPNRMQRAIDLVVAIAQGDAFAEDVPAFVMNDGYADDLDTVIASLGEAARQSVDPSLPHRPFDPSVFARQAAPDVCKDQVYTMKLPFLHEGTIYDPQDAARFNGQALNLVAVQGQVLAFTNHESHRRIQELLYITNNVDPTQEITIAIPGLTVSDMGPVPIEDIFPGIDEEDIGGHFYEHASHGGYGSHLFCPKNRGYWRLSEVSDGLFGDWNDKISSFRCWSTWDQSCNVGQLWQDRWWGPPSFTSVGTGRECYAYHQLDSVGWNDRASGVAAW